MSSERIVSRFYGSEIEYNYRKTSSGGLTERQPTIKKMGSFLANGSRLYMDLGNHPEYATPECGTLKELVTHEIAGEEIVWEAYRNKDDNDNGVNSLHKRCIAPDKNDTSGNSRTSGAHENYATSLDWNYTEMPKRTSDALGMHFATRTIFIGAGQATERHGYVLGQKMEDIRNEVGNQTTSQSKTLVNIRAEHHSRNSNLRRLHVICGDANISPWAVRMKFGTTSLVLRLLEHDVDIRDLSLKKPLDAAHLVAGNVDGMRAEIPSTTGKSLTALNMQEELAKRAHDLSQRIELPQEELAVIDDWFTTVDALRSYSSGRELDQKSKHIIEQIDWYTKKERLDRVREQRRDNQLSADEEHMRDLAYDLMYDQVPDGTGAKLRKSRFARYSPSQSEIQAAKVTPPEGRAKLRGAIIERNFPSAAVIDWSEFNKKSIPLYGDYSDEGIKKWLDTNL